MNKTHVLQKGHKVKKKKIIQEGLNLVFWFEMLRISGNFMNNVIKVEFWGKMLTEGFPYVVIFEMAYIWKELASEGYECTEEV